MRSHPPLQVHLLNTSFNLSQRLTRLLINDPVFSPPPLTHIRGRPALKCIPIWLSMTHRYHALLRLLQPLPISPRLTFPTTLAVMGLIAKCSLHLRCCVLRIHMAMLHMEVCPMRHSSIPGTLESWIIQFRIMNPTTLEPPLIQPRLIPHAIGTLPPNWYPMSSRMCA